MAQNKKYEFTDFSQPDKDPAPAKKNTASKTTAQKSKKATLTNQGVVFVEDYDDEDDFRSTVQKKSKKKQPAKKGKKKNKVGLIFSLLFLVAIVIVMVIVLSFMNILNKDTVYDGIYINGISVAGYSKEELTEYITDTYITPLKNGKITVNIIDETLDYPLNEFISLPDAVALANQAYEFGRKGSMVERFRQIENLKSKNENLSIGYTIDSEKFTDIVDTAYEKVFKELKQPEYNVKTNGVSFTYGINGVNVNIDKLRADIEEAFSTLQQSLSTLTQGQDIPNITITVEAETVHFNPIKKEDVINQIYIAPKEPYYTADANGNFVIIPGEPGRSLDEEALTLLLARINGGEKVVYEELNFIDVPPSTTTEDIEKTLFDNIISNGNLNTGLSSDDPTIEFKNEREVNIALAIAKLNNLVLMPGQEFSFLDVIGDITEEAGYIFAYENFEGEEGKVLGGGLSMLASTIYEALLKGGFSPEEHHNYSYRPYFGTYGLDAYISQDKGYDLTFKNISTEPIRLSFILSEQYMSCFISGIETEPIQKEENTKVEIQAVRTRRILYDTKYIDDPNMIEGAEIVMVPGINGYIYEIHLKTSYLDDLGNETVSTTTLVETVIYASRERVVLRGTKKFNIDDINPEDMIV